MHDKTLVSEYLVQTAEKPKMISFLLDRVPHVEPQPATFMLPLGRAAWELVLALAVAMGVLTVVATASHSISCQAVWTTVVFDVELTTY